MSPSYRAAYRPTGSRARRLVIALTTTLLLTLVGTPVAAAAPPPPARIVEGTLANGTAYRIVVPEGWRGVLVMNPDLVEPDSAIGRWFQQRGYASASRARDITDWRVQAGADDLVELKQIFTTRVGRPRAVVLYGGSLGGLVTRDAAESHPRVFDAVIPTCGGGAGLVGMWNHRLDALFAIRTLLAPDDDRLELVDIDDQAGTDAALRAAVQTALTTAPGRARLALAAAIGQVSGWPTGAAQPPAPGDLDTQIRAIAASLSILQLRRSVLESTAGGNISWNAGIDYRRQFSESSGRHIAATLYRAAGLSLDNDLHRINTAPRVRADREAVDWARDNGVYTGQIRVPVLSLFTAVDPRAALSEMRPYDDVVRRAGNARLLRQVVVNRSGHCAFSAAEIAAAIDVTLKRLHTGRWAATADPAWLNHRAAQLDAEAGGSLGDATFTSFGPVPPFPRAFYAYTPLPWYAAR